MGRRGSRRHRLAAGSIWLVCAVWVTVIAITALGGDPTGDETEGRGTLLLVSLAWTAVFGWLGYEVWHGRRVMALVGIFVPITLVWAAIGLALTLSGDANTSDLDLTTSIIVFVGGLGTAVFLVRAALN